MHQTNLSSVSQIYFLYAKGLKFSDKCQNSIYEVAVLPGEGQKKRVLVHDTNTRLRRKIGPLSNPAGSDSYPKY